MDIDKEIVRLRTQGVMQKDIAKQLSVTIDKVKYVVEKHGLQNYKYQKVCMNCNDEFETVRHSAKFCSEKCRRKYNKANRGHKQTCSNCGKVFSNYNPRITCSMECHSEMKERQRLIRRLINVLKPKPEPNFKRQCKNCGTTYKTNYSLKVYCSDECSYRYRYESIVREKELHHHKCKECGKHFSDTRKKREFCSYKCGRKYGHRKKDTVRRLRIKRNGKVDWNISVERLVKRDKGICYLCNEQVNTNVDPNDDYYPSIEHVIPVSKGGTHTWNNVRLAHRICNTEKGTNILEKAKA